MGGDINTEPVEPKWEASDPIGSFRRHAEFLHERAKGVFLKDGTHVELMFVFKPDGECLLTLVRGDRDEFLANLKGLIRDSDTIGVVHVAEAWMRLGGTKDHITKQIAMGEMRVSDLRPEDRLETLMVSSQSRDGRGTCWVEPILRDDTGKPSLGEGFVVDGVGGRFGRLFG